MTTRFYAPLLSATLIGLPLALAGCGAKAPPGAPPPPIPYAEAILYDSAGQRTGKVTLTPQGDAFAGIIEVVGGLTPGPHGMHIHTVGQCKLPDFASAGAHFNPTGKQHGLNNPMGHHEGDLPLLNADPYGKAKTQFMVHTTMEALFDGDGSSFVVHADADDMKTDPAGNSGSRIMCGVFYRKTP